ncbi:MAG: NAD(P)-binding domain-containing protein, partial [Burkholderiales bacterium]|nr:NAD(P)-binding domain-containing protein [Burkholderiales bacterium]
MKIGFIGIGTMGGHMAFNLRKAGFEVTVNDLNRKLADRHIAVGAKWADSVRQLAQESEVI